MKRILNFDFRFFIGGRRGCASPVLLRGLAHQGKGAAVSECLPTGSRRYSRLGGLRYEDAFRTSPGRSFRAKAGSHSNAFSLIELLVTMGLLSFIVLGLLAVFNQTQRAFTSSLTQTDVLEAGRATMGSLGSEVEMSMPSRAPDYLVNGVLQRATNFFVEPSPGFLVPFMQELPGSADVRTNFVDRFFFLNRINQDWIGIGYQVLPDDANGYVGSLYRFSSTNDRYGTLTLPGDFEYAANIAFQNARAGLPVTNVNWRSANNLPRTFAISRIADGVMNFRVRVFATNGFLIRAKGAFPTHIRRSLVRTPDRHLIF